MDTLIGFDSAWAGNAKAPGAITAITIDAGVPVKWYAPQLVGFDDALGFIHEVTGGSTYSLVAIDQPTIVPNLTGSRPVERLAGSLVSWNGGGTQPSNRGKVGMFCDASPIWPFLSALGAIEAPELARTAPQGRFVMETYPAAALPTIVGSSFKPRGALKYNPANPNFRIGDWILATNAAAAEARDLALSDVAQWCAEAADIEKPRKGDQDKLDAVLCLLIALRWRVRPRSASVVLGDPQTGYMVVPASEPVRGYLTQAARKKRVPIDGVVPPPPEARRLRSRQMRPDGSHAPGDGIAGT